jgi:aminocarboxymuconate-semialdehyde decarboxylase
MSVDVHAHYVPPAMLDTLQQRGAEFGVSLHHAPGCQCALHFNNGPKIRPFFAPLIEPMADRLKNMDRTGVGRQVLSSWCDIFGPHLVDAAAAKWHGLLNEYLAKVRDEQPERFSFLASVPLGSGEGAASALRHAVKELGAVGATLPANVAEVNLGDLDLDAFWQEAVDLDVGVFIHPVQAIPLSRSARHGLTQIVQYTSDTSLSVGSLIFSGVLDRFPALRLLLSHGGGALPYLSGRFDVMHERMDRAGQGDVAAHAPSSYLGRFFYDTVLHDPEILRWLVSRVSAQRVLLGSDYSFPPADRDPVATVRRAGFSDEEVEWILDDNATVLFPALA